jgi:hypothetical protein
VGKILQAKKAASTGSATADTSKEEAEVDRLVYAPLRTDNKEAKHLNLFTPVLSGVKKDVILVRKFSPKILAETLEVQK